MNVLDRVVHSNQYKHIIKLREFTLGRNQVDTGHKIIFLKVNFFYNIN